MQKKAFCFYNGLFLCFNLGENLNFRDFLQKRFYNIDHRCGAAKRVYERVSREQCDQMFR